MFVVHPAALFQDLAAVVGIAVNTAVSACIVEAQVNTRGTAAFGALVLVLLCVEGTAQKV